MKANIRRMFALLSALAICLGATVGVFAEGSVTFQGASKKFIFAPGSEYSPTDLFENFKNVMPGDKLTQQITVRNDVSNDVKVNIYMRARSAQPGSEVFLSQMNMTVAKSENNTMAYMFDASADQTAGLSDWVLLGMLYSGGEVNLEVTLDVPITMGNEFQDAVGYLDWEFKVEAFDVEPDDPQAPQTGDDSGLVLWMCVGAVTITVVFIAVFSRKRRVLDEE